MHALAEAPHPRCPHSRPASSAPWQALLGAKELQVQLTCGDFNIETPWKTSGSSFLFEKELALPDNELEFMIFGRGGAQGNMGAPGLARWSSAAAS